MHLHEETQQRSLMIVGESGGANLASYVDYLRGTGYLSAQLREGFNLLWLIDENGDIRVALEEWVVSAEPNVVSAPMPRDLPPALARHKLGHPALVSGGVARIGGELSLHPSGRLLISNKSGRFGLMRSRDHLDHAAELFGSRGIDVTPAFMEIGL